MIYAIRAVGTEYVKIGVATSVGNRLRQLETGCPHELHIEAVADWPHTHESAIHLYLRKHCQKYEWFVDSEDTSRVIGWLNKGEEGLRAFRVAFMEFAGNVRRLHSLVDAAFKPPSGKPRVPNAPTLAQWGKQELKNERYESIKQRALARQQSVKRRKAAISQSTG